MNNRWIPVEERLPEADKYIMLSFENFDLPVVGRYEEDDNGFGNFYIGDSDESCISEDLHVNAWMPILKPYRGEDDSDEVNHTENYELKNKYIDEMILIFGIEAVKNFCACNIYKYSECMNNGPEDLRKVHWYMGKLDELIDLELDMELEQDMGLMEMGLDVDM